MQQTKKLKPLPQFQTEAEEQEFWAAHSSMDYIDWEQADVVIFTNLKPSTRTISLRLPEELLSRIKVRAHKLGLPYQSFLKMKLNELIR